MARLGESLPSSEVIDQSVFYRDHKYLNEYLQEKQHQQVQRKQHALKGYFYNNPAANDPRHYMQPAKAAMKEVVTRIIGVCGSEGKI